MDPTTADLDLQGLGRVQVEVVSQGTGRPIPPAARRRREFLAAQPVSRA